MAAKINPVDLIRFLSFINQIIGPAVEIVEMLKEAFKSKEKKFIEIAIEAYGTDEAEKVQEILVNCIRKLKIGLPCVEENLSAALLVDCLIEHLHKNIKSKKVRNDVFKELAMEIGEMLNQGKLKAPDSYKWDALVEHVYSKKKNGGFKFLNGRSNNVVDNGKA